MGDLLPALPEPGAPAFTSELDEALLVGHAPPDVAKRWRVDSLSSAEWAMRRRVALQDEHDRVVATASEARATYDAWEKAELARLKGSEDYFDAKLSEYAIAVRNADERHKTLSLPSGKVETRKATQPSVHVAEGRDDDVIAWCKQNLDAVDRDAVVKSTERLLISELAKRVRVVKNVDDGKYKVIDPKTGEIVPGLWVQEVGEPTATVKPNNG